MNLNEPSLRPLGTRQNVELMRRELKSHLEIKITLKFFFNFVTNLNSLVVLLVVLLAPLVLELLPVLAVPAGGQQGHVATVVQVVQGVPRLGADAVDVSLALEGKEVLLLNGKSVKVKAI